MAEPLNSDTAVPRLAAVTSAQARVSFEFFPPKDELGRKSLQQTIKRLAPLAPEFASVTYGAGGSTRHRTLETVIQLQKETSMPIAAHLTCMGAQRTEIDCLAQGYWTQGIRHIVALRGDAPNGDSFTYTRHPALYGSSVDLIAGLKRVADFEISVSAYPERHPDSPSWEHELDYLKRKIDAGSTRAITQFFFSADVFLRFLERVRAAGIDIPIVPGIMLQPNFKSVCRMANMCAVDVPDWYGKLFEGLEQDKLTRQLLTASLTVDLVAELRNHGVQDFHLYTLNRADIALAICRVLGVGQAISKAA